MVIQAPKRGPRVDEGPGRLCSFGGHLGLWPGQGLAPSVTVLVQTSGIAARDDRETGPPGLSGPADTGCSPRGGSPPRGAWSASSGTGRDPTPSPCSWEVVHQVEQAWQGVRGHGRCGRSASSRVSRSARRRPAAVRCRHWRTRPWSACATRRVIGDLGPVGHVQFDVARPRRCWRPSGQHRASLPAGRAERGGELDQRDGGGAVERGAHRRRAGRGGSRRPRATADPAVPGAQPPRRRPRRPPGRRAARTGHITRSLAPAILVHAITASTMFSALPCTTSAPLCTCTPLASRRTAAAGSSRSATWRTAEEALQDAARTSRR